MSFLQSFEQDAFDDLYALIQGGQSATDNQVSDVLHTAFTSALVTSPTDVSNTLSGLQASSGTGTSSLPPQVPSVPVIPNIPGSATGGNSTGGQASGGLGTGSGLGIGADLPGTGTSGASASAGTGTVGGNGTSSTQPQTGTGGAGSSGKSGTPMGTFHIPGLNQTVKEVSVSSTGLSVPITLGKTQVQLTVPQSALPLGTSVNVTTADPNNGIAAVAPVGYQVSVAVGVEFTGTPTLPVRLQITDKSIVSQSKVYKVTSTGLIPVVANVTNGQATILFTTDPDFVVVTPVKEHSIGKSQRGIYLDGTQLSVVPAMVHAKTTYMPIWYVMSALNQLGIQSHWNGHEWSLSTTDSVSANLANLAPGKGDMFISVNGTKVQSLPGLTEKDPSSGKNTMFMPVWYVMGVLDRLGVESKWDGTHWYLTVKS